MRWLLSLAFAITLVVPTLRAADKDPLRFFPESANAVVKVENPRALVEAILKHPLAKDAPEPANCSRFSRQRRFPPLLSNGCPL